MNNSKKYYGVIGFCVIVVALIVGVYMIIAPKINQMNVQKETIAKKEQELADGKRDLAIVQKKIKQIKDSISGSQKKIYSPIESDLGNDTLFFTLYSDVIEMVHSNSIKIKAIDYIYNPESDAFVKFGKDVYFVCDVNMELVSNYVNLGKLIQDLYQYPYYIKINELEVKPYDKDKKILLTTLSIRLYAHTAPEEESATEASAAAPAAEEPLEGAATALPQ